MRRTAHSTHLQGMEAAFDDDDDDADDDDDDDGGGSDDDERHHHQQVRDWVSWKAASQWFLPSFGKRQSARNAARFIPLLQASASAWIHVNERDQVQTGAMKQNVWRPSARRVAGHAAAPASCQLPQPGNPVIRILNFVAVRNSIIVSTCQISTC